MPANRASLRIIVVLGILMGLCSFSPGLAAGSQVDRADDGKEQPKVVSVDPDEEASKNVVSPYVDVLHDLIADRKLEGLGYVRISDTDADRHVDVWWKGDVPAPVRDLVKDWPFPVVFRSADHTLSEVEETEAQLSDAAPKFPFRVKGFFIEQGGGASIVLEVRTEDVEQALGFVRDPSNLAKYGIDTQVPLTVVSDDSKPPTPAGRGDDTAPFYGGGYLDEDGDGNSEPDCTSGFKVSGPNVTGLLTARHCGTSRCWTTTQDLRIGCTGAGVKKVDSMIVSGKTYGPRIFDDQDPYPVNLSGPDSNIPVVGVRNPDEGERICFSGGFSGLECSGAYVNKTGKYTVMGEYGDYMFGPGFWSYNDQSGRVHGFAGPGDSGGPVFARTETSTGAYEARARGIITAIHSDLMKCPGYEEGDYRYCAVSVFSMNISAIESQQNVQVVLD